jgi:hypothetical protein
MLKYLELFLLFTEIVGAIICTCSLFYEYNFLGEKTIDFGITLSCGSLCVSDLLKRYIDRNKILD